MCGIVGQVGAIGSLESAEQVVRRQLALLRHRGPDDAQWIIDAQFAFGHVRLAIIDPQHGAQPFVSDDGNLVVTYNGEIYNYVELRDELRARGASFRTASDTEVLLRGTGTGAHACSTGSTACSRSRSTTGPVASSFCARDPFGQKPFYWMHSQSRFAFASECRTFACLPGFAAELDLASIADFLAFECLPFDRSIYRDVHKLPPGHALRYRDGKVEIDRYFESVPRDARECPRDAEERVTALLRRSVERTFRADVPVGLLLSGGLDSSLVLSFLREVHPSVPLRTYTVRNVDPSYDESEAAALLASRFGTSHTVVTAEPAALAAVASEIPTLLDEPQADPGLLPKYLVCREIARTTKVALTGDGGDELFYGYAIFRAQRAARLVRRLPDVVHRRLLGPLARLLPASDRYMGFDLRLKQFAKGFPAPDALRNFYWTCAFSDRELPGLLMAARCDLHDVGVQLARQRAVWERAAGPLGRLAYQYQQQYLPDYVLTNSDRASMLNSVELRTPFLAPDLAVYVNALPDRMKMRNGQTKALLRTLARGRLPTEILKRPKIGFTSPVATLDQGPLADEVREYLGPGRLRREGLFNPSYVARILDEHFTNRHNHYKQIWVLFMLQKWISAHGSVLR